MKNVIAYDDVDVGTLIFADWDYIGRRIYVVLDRGCRLEYFVAININTNKIAEFVYEKKYACSFKFVK